MRSWINLSKIQMMYLEFFIKYVLAFRWCSKTILREMLQEVWQFLKEKHMVDLDKKMYKILLTFISAKVLWDIYHIGHKILRIETPKSRKYSFLVTKRVWNSKPI